MRIWAMELPFSMQTSNREWTKDLAGHYKNDDAQAANKYTNNCTSHQSLKEAQIETTMGYTLSKLKLKKKKMPSIGANVGVYLSISTLKIFCNSY